VYCWYNRVCQVQFYVIWLLTCTLLKKLWITFLARL